MKNHGIDFTPKDRVSDNSDIRENDETPDVIDVGNGLLAGKQDKIPAPWLDTRGTEKRNDHL